MAVFWHILTLFILLAISFAIGYFLSFYVLFKNVKTEPEKETNSDEITKTPVATAVDLEQNVESDNVEEIVDIVDETSATPTTSSLTEEEKDEKIAQLAAIEVSEDDKPETLSVARGGKADNLKRIKGIGPVNEKRLHELGIYHFDQIAKWGDREIAWMDGFLSFKGRIIRENWVEQADQLAKGEDTEFSKRVDKGDVSSSK